MHCDVRKGCVSMANAFLEMNLVDHVASKYQCFTTMYQPFNELRCNLVNSHSNHCVTFVNLDATKDIPVIVVK